MSLHSSIATVGSGTAVSRLVGFIREILIARYLGAGMMADAFFVALRFPNLFRSLFAEGTLNVAFVPLFSGMLQSKGRMKALAFARAVFSFLFYVLLIFTVLMEVLMPAFMFILAHGFNTIPGKLELATTLTRITFPFLLCVSIVSLFSGVLNSVGKFWAAAFTPALQNIVMICFLICLTPCLNTPNAPAYALSIGVVVAGIVEILFLWRQLKKVNMTFGLCTPKKALGHLSGDVKTLLKKMAPGVLGSGVYQINLFLDTLLVSCVGAGAISWLNYANHLFQLPIGVIGVAIGTVLLPVLSRHIKAGQMSEANTELNRGLEVSLALALSSMVGLILLATPIVSILLEHGAFKHQDTINTAKVLVVFACGLPAYMMTKSLAPFFYARGDTTTPVKIAVVGVILNVMMALILMQFWGYLGIAAATTLSVWINAIQYMVRLHHRGDFQLDEEFKYRLPRIMTAVLMMAGVIYGLKAGLDCFYPIWAQGRGFLSAVVLGGIIAISVMVFVGGLILTKGISAHQFKKVLKRQSVS